MSTSNDHDDLGNEEEEPECRVCRGPAEEGYVTVSRLV
jgi:hypothetical protein